MDPTLIRCDDALAQPVLFIGPGEHGGAIFEGVGALLDCDLDYGPDGKERVDASALEDVSGWEGLPVVPPGDAHDAKRIAKDPTIQGRAAIGTIIRSRYDSEQRRRIHRFAVHDPAHVRKIRRPPHGTGEWSMMSEAYTPTMRQPTEAERADGIVGAQVARKPQSLAVCFRARAGAGAYVRTDGEAMDPEEKVEGEFSLDALAATIEAIPDDSPYADAIAAILATKIAKLAKKEMEIEGSPQTPAADAPMAPEMMAMKADADKQRARADKAEAELRRVALVKIKTDAADAGLTVGGLDKADPTAADLAAAEKALADAALAKVRADAAKGRADGERRNPLTIPPLGLPRADADKKPVRLPTA